MIVARVHRTRDTLFFKRRIHRREKRPASIVLTDISRLEVWQYRDYHVKEGAIVGAAVGIMFISAERESGHPQAMGGLAPVLSTVHDISRTPLAFLGGISRWPYDRRVVR